MIIKLKVSFFKFILEHSVFNYEHIEELRIILGYCKAYETKSEMLSQLEDSEIITIVEKEVLGVFMPRLLSFNVSSKERRKYQKRKSDSVDSCSSELNLKKDDIYEIILNNRVLFDQILSIEHSVINQCIDLFKQYFFDNNFSLNNNHHNNNNCLFNNEKDNSLKVNHVKEDKNFLDDSLFKELVRGTLFLNNLVAINKQFSFNTQLSNNDLINYFYNTTQKSGDLIKVVMKNFYEELKQLLI
jgi:hypothetical protein